MATQAHIRHVAQILPGVPVKLAPRRWRSACFTSELHPQTEKLTVFRPLINYFSFVFSFFVCYQCVRSQTYIEPRLLSQAVLLRIRDLRFTSPVLS